METRTQQDTRLRREIEHRLRHMGTDDEVTKALAYYDSLTDWGKSSSYVDISLGCSWIRWDWFYRALTA